MRAPRISIAGLMGFIALLGVTFSALHAVTEFSASAMLTLALAASGAALLGRLTTRGTDKAAWTGYLVFGTGYLALCVGPWCDEHVMPNLVTTEFIEEQYSKLEYTPRHAGERVWTSEGTGRLYAAGEVFGHVGAETTSFDVAHDRGTTSRYSSPQLLARYLFGSRQDGSIRGRGVASAFSA
jgi:hypothetical protein